MNNGSLVSNCKRLVARIHAVTATPKARFWMRILGLSILVAGVAWSVSTLDLTLDKISLKLLMLNLCISAPLNLGLAAVSLRLNANAVERSISGPDAIQTAAMANAAELLPLPGGAMVRGAALIRAGASLKESASIVTTTAILTLTMTIVLSATALALLGQPAAWVLVFAGGIGFVGLLVWMSKHFSSHLLASMLVVRLATMAVGVAALAVAFATLGDPVGLTEAALYLVAIALGSTIAIVPAGFGINEAFAAGLASLISGSPASAFLAVALNRATGLTAGATLSGLFLLARRSQT